MMAGQKKKKFIMVELMGQVKVSPASVIPESANANRH